MFFCGLVSSLVGLGLIAQKNGDQPEVVRQCSRTSALEHTDVQGGCSQQALRQEGRWDEANAVLSARHACRQILRKRRKTAESLFSAILKRGRGDP